jgi:hypothetical protein
MLVSHIDHLVITAPSLAAGVDYVIDALGVSPRPGGEHPRMGTHNSLLRLGETLYLEVIAANPAAPPPDRPRWFRLDDVFFNTSPQLAGWVARTKDVRAAAAAASFHLGQVEPMSRASLRWLITIPDDGSIPFDGIAPLLIEWSTPVHPAASMPESGCTLVGLEGCHPQAAAVSDLLRSIGFQEAPGLFTLEPAESPALVAAIRTPSGLRRLGAS